jgi:flagellar biosynthesis protein FliQ
VDAITTWWDGVEEWLTSLSFVPQILVCAAVVVPLAIGLSYLMNLLVDTSFRLADRRESVESEIGDE